jgi:hypothetical protein
LSARGLDCAVLIALLALAVAPGARPDGTLSTPRRHSPSRQRVKLKRLVEEDLSVLKEFALLEQLELLRNLELFVDGEQASEVPRGERDKVRK